MKNNNQNKNHIIILTTTFPTGKKNNDHFLYDLCKKYSEQFTVHIITPSINGHFYHKLIKGMHIYQHPITIFGDFGLCYRDGMPTNLSKNKFLFVLTPFLILSQLFSLHMVITKYKVGLIHIQWLVPSGLSAVIYKKYINRNIKLLVTVRGSDLNHFNKSLFNSLKIYVLKNVNKIVTVSENLKQKIEKLSYSGKIEVYPTGVNTAVFKPINKNNFHKNKNILYVGSIIENKGIRHLIGAMEKIVNLKPNTKLTVIGDGSLLKEMRVLVKNKNLTKSVIFMGRVENKLLPAFYRNSDLFILPSFSEGFPISISEALSSGVICITSNLPVFTDLEKKHSFIKTVNLAKKDDLPNTILDLLTRSNDFVIKNAAREFAANNLSRDKTNKAYVDMVRELLSTR